MEHHGPTSWLLKIPFLPHDESMIHVNSGFVVFGIIVVCSVLAYFGIKDQTEHHIVPSPKFQASALADMVVEKLYNMIMGLLGPGGEMHFSFIASCFLFIFIGNFLGLLPMSDSPNANLNTSIALGLITFLYYNIMGIRAHGLKGYINHFLMGLGILGIPIAFLELISHVLRPMTLGFRLAVNIQVDHILGQKFAEIFAWILPIPMLVFGILVSFVQAFVFTVLTSIYVQMATEHADHGGEHEAHGHH